MANQSETDPTIQNDELAKDTVDSIRLKKASSRNSVETIEWNNKTDSSATDLDIDQLDAEFQQLSLDYKQNRSALLKDPSNKALRQELDAVMKNLSRIKTWTSLVQTKDGIAIVKDAMRKKRENNINQRKYEIDEVLKLTKAQSAVDICFLVDCTGSMTEYLDAAKQHIRQLTKTIIGLYDTKPRLAFVGYRDINECIELLDFTDDINVFETCLYLVQATGGGDICEDVFSGLELVPQLRWSNPNRIMIHICDAPCHGRDYHELPDTSNDKYPKGDPHNRELSKLLLDIKRLQIIYCKINLSAETKKMFDEFTFIYGNISEIHIDNPSVLIKRICQETSAAIMSSIDMTMSSFRTLNKPIKPYTLLGKEPDWNTIEAHDVYTIEILKPEKFDDLFRPLFIGRGSGQMKIAPYPFSKGSLRFAFYGKFSSDDFEPIDVVFKEFISTDPKANSLQVYQEHLEIQVIAQFLANRFNAEMTRIFRKPILVAYADADLVQQKADESKIYQVEARMHRTWHKWNNNSGGVSINEYSTVLQAFSHWTCHVTAGRLMVVDLQGVKADDAFLLTDPAIHCDYLLRFPHTRTNFGVKGMRRFFRTHVCSEVCTLLELTSSNLSTCSARIPTTELLEYYDALEPIDNIMDKTVQFEVDMPDKEDPHGKTLERC